MKTLLTLALTCLLVYQGRAQNKIPAFGKIDKEDLEMKDCDFDKGAAAFKLIDHGKMFYDRGTFGMTLFKTRYEYRVRIKILKDKGLSYANVEIPYYSGGDREKISHIDACTFNLDENGKIKVTDVGKSSIYTKKFNKRYSRIIIAFPEAKVGSVIEYRYKLEREIYTDVRGWFFQDEIPTRYSEYEVNIPRLFSFTSEPSIVDPVDVKEKESDEVVSIDNDTYTLKTLKKNYVMRNLIGIRKEVFMGALKDYKQRVEFLLSEINHGSKGYENLRTTWTDVVNLLKKDEDFGLQLSGEIPGLNAVVKEALLITDKTQRANFLFNTVRTRMTCSDHEAIYTEEGVNKAWQKKNGNIADINLTLVNLLNKAGITAFPILLSTRENGMVNTSYHSLNQFNVVMAYLETGNGFLVLDASDKISNYKLTPEPIVNTRGFIVNNDRGKWVDVVDNIHKYSVMVALRGMIDENGIMNGDCAVNSMDYSRKQRVAQFEKNADGFKQAYFIKPYPGVLIKEFEVKNATTDSLPLVQKISFSVPLNKSGEYSYFNTNLFNDLETNPFIEENRVADVDFGFQQEFLFYGNFTIPDGYSFETLPQDIVMAMPGRGILYSRSMLASGNVLNLKITVDFKQSFYPSNAYADFHEFYKKLMNSLSEQVVIKKKS